jgi:hypothetical protein
MHAAATYLRKQAPPISSDDPREKRWSTDDLRKMFRNPAYLGHSRIGSEKKGTLQVNKEAHEPLATLATWTAAQSEPRYRRTNGHYPLSGITRCGHCGGPMTGSRQTVKGREYRRMVCSCANNGSVSGKGHAAIRAEVLEDHVRAIVKGELESGDGWWMRYVPGDVEAAQEALERAEAELAAFATDTTLREILGEKYHDGARERRDALDVASVAYRELASQKAINADLPAAEELDKPEKFAGALGVMVDHITIRPGRGSIEDRVVIDWAEDADA